MTSLEELCQKATERTGLNVEQLLSDIGKGSEKQRKYICLWLLDENPLDCAYILHQGRESTPEEWDEYIEIINEISRKQQLEKNKKNKKERQSFAFNQPYLLQQRDELMQTKKQSLRLDVLNVLIGYFNLKTHISHYINGDLKALLASLGLETERLSQGNVIGHLKRQGY